MTMFRPSSIPWIGDIPQEWKIIKLKYASQLKGRIGWQGLTTDEYRAEGPYLVTGTDFDNGVVNWERCQHVSEKRFQLDIAIQIKEDDLLITKDGTIGKVAVSKNCPEKVCLNSGVFIIRNTGNFKYYSRFMYYVLQSEELQSWFSITDRGNSTVKHLTQEKFYNFSFAYPSVDEQRAIANYLDDRCSKIDEIIAEAEKSIEEYKELKQAVIFEAVTKGLDKNVPKKDSGVEWIGMIPVHWRVKKFKYVASVNANLVSPDEYMDYQQIAPDCIEKDSGRLIKERTVAEAGVESWNQLFRRGQLIYSKIRPILNKVIIAPYDGLCSADMYPLDVVEDIEFVQKAMLSRYFVDQVGLITQDRVKMPKINKEELANIYMAIPPYNEQLEIVKYLNVRMADIDGVIDEKQVLIKDLQAYKKSLIYEVVTGKRRIS